DAGVRAVVDEIVCAVVGGGSEVHSVDDAVGAVLVDEHASPGGAAAPRPQFGNPYPGSGPGDVNIVKRTHALTGPRHDPADRYVSAAIYFYAVSVHVHHVHFRDDVRRGGID